MALDARRVAESHAALALALLVDPSTVPDVNRAILLLDEARAGLVGLDPIIALLFNRPVPRISEAIIALRAMLPDTTSTVAIDDSMNRLQSTIRTIQSSALPIMMWRQLLDTAPTDNLKATAARKLQTALSGMQLNADALKRTASDLAGCANVVYMEHRRSEREELLASSSQIRSEPS